MADETFDAKAYLDRVAAKPRSIFEDQRDLVSAKAAGATRRIYSSHKRILLGDSCNRKDSIRRGLARAPEAPIAGVPGQWSIS